MVANSGRSLTSHFSLGEHSTLPFASGRVLDEVDCLKIHVPAMPPKGNVVRSSRALIRLLLSTWDSPRKPTRASPSVRSPCVRIPPFDRWQRRKRVVALEVRPERGPDTARAGAALSPRSSSACLQIDCEKSATRMVGLSSDESSVRDKELSILRDLASRGTRREERRRMLLGKLSGPLRHARPNQ